ncbi:MAG: class I SAM-dependent methyltransferase [Candidatus Omnitrophica bacterium]|nr:class I SAM-dependent methyltransferase [Candidatus Omnitrophota bacterium]
MDSYCRCCGSKKYKIVAMLHNVDIAVCKVCGLAFVIRETKANSGSTYFSDFNLENYTTYYKDFREYYFKKHLDTLERLAAKGPILDIGCSFGWFLKIAKDSGWEAFGIEQTEDIARKASQEYGLDILSNLGDIDKFNKKFNAITLWNVLEHMAEPEEALKTLHSKLKDYGILVVSVPNINGLFYRLSFLSYRLSFGKFKFPLEQLYQAYNPYMHLFNYSVSTLSLMLKKSDFQTIKVFKQPVIDVKKIKYRLGIDCKLNFFSKYLLIILTKSVYFISRILYMDDEIVIYGRKTQVKAG